MKSIYRNDIESNYNYGTTGEENKQGESLANPANCTAAYSRSNGAVRKGSIKVGIG